jgi:hypothetical protein
MLQLDFEIFGDALHRRGQRVDVAQSERSLQGRSLARSSCPSFADSSRSTSAPTCTGVIVIDWLRSSPPTRTRERHIMASA